MRRRYDKMKIESVYNGLLLLRRYHLMPVHCDCLEHASNVKLGHLTRETSSYTGQISEMSTHDTALV